MMQSPSRPSSRHRHRHSGRLVIVSIPYACQARQDDAAQRSRISFRCRRRPIGGGQGLVGLFAVLSGAGEDEREHMCPYR